LFRFYTETASFGVLIKPKQTEEQPKQFDREHILVFFHEMREKNPAKIPVLEQNEQCGTLKNKMSPTHRSLADPYCNIIDT
jgi:hypothetical protein